MLFRSFYDNKDSAKQTEEIQRISHEWRHQILNTFPKPTITSINGYCFGGAFTIVASSDIAIAANEATFGLSEINFGSIPGGLVAKAISTEMSYRQMLYYSLTGEQFDGKRSVEIGFTTMSVPRTELEAKTLAVATVLKGKDRHALRATKDAFKAVDIRSMSYEDARSWLKARLTQMTYEQKNANWIEHGIGKFIEGVYQPGKGAAPKAAR